MSETATYLLNRRKQLELELSELQAELTRVKMAIIAVNRTAPSENANVRPVGGLDYNPLNTKSIKEMILEVLDSAPRGLKALGILECINEGYSIKLERTSLSPQLSRLKRDGKIHKTGLYWAKVSKAHNNDDPYDDIASKANRLEPPV